MNDQPYKLGSLEGAAAGASEGAREGMARTQPVGDAAPMAAAAPSIKGSLALGNSPVAVGRRSQQPVSRKLARGASRAFRSFRR